MILRQNILSLIAVVTGGVFSSALMAQNTSLLRPEDMEKRSPWLTSENAAGLTMMSSDERVSDVKLYGDLISGGLRNYNEAEQGHEWGLKGFSYCPISERVAVCGKMSYSNFQGKNMTGSYFIDPSQTPFNLIEMTEENPGDKQLETYHLAGGVGAELTRWLSAGLKMDYTAANYAKRKDLRHTNTLMDMTLSAGLNFHPTSDLTLGINYTYRRRNESLMLSMYGTTDRLYYSLIDYGAFFGKRELFSDTGYTKENEAKPLFDSYHGGALQISWRIGNLLEWYNQFGFRMRKGYYGDDSPSTIVYSTHNGATLSYIGNIVYNDRDNAHILRLEAEHRQVENKENIYDFRNDEVGINYYVYLTDAEVGARSEQEISVLYSGQFDIKHGLPLWQTDIQVCYGHRKQKAVNYPDYRIQDIAWWRFSSSLGRNFISGVNIYTIGANLGYGLGNGNACMDGRYSTPNEVETLTRTLDELLMHDYEYHTSDRIYAGAEIRYTRIIGKKGLRSYIELNYDFCKAFKTIYLGNAMRHMTGVSIGCNF